MREGTYRLYRTFSEHDGSQLVARFVIAGTKVTVLEDHGNIMESLIPTDRLTDNVLMRLSQMEHSPYWRLVNEDDIQAGEHDDLLPEA